MMLTNYTQASEEGSARFTTAQLSIIVFLFSLTSLLVLVSYLWVIVTVARTRSLHTASNCFLVSLAVAEIVLGVFGLHVLTVFTSIPRFSFAPIFFLSWMLAFCFFGYFLNVTLVATDKWLKISHPFVYVRVVTRAKCIICLAVVWTSSVVGSIIGAVAHVMSMDKIPDNWAAVYRSFSRVVIIFSDAVILPFVIVISAFNIAIVRIARRQARAIAGNLPAPTRQLHPRLAESSTGAQVQAPPNPPARHNGLGQSKSIRQFSLYLFSFVLTWVPMIIFTHIVQATEAMQEPAVFTAVMICSSLCLGYCAFGTLILTLVQPEYRQVLKENLRALRGRIQC